MAGPSEGIPKGSPPMKKGKGKGSKSVRSAGSGKKAGGC